MVPESIGPVHREILFPTPVYFKMVKDPQKLNKYLFPLIKAWSEKEESEKKTNSGGGWHSSTEMQHKKNTSLWSMNSLLCNMKFLRTMVWNLNLV